jgi:hypothetical protein
VTSPTTPAKNKHWQRELLAHIPVFLGTALVVGACFVLTSKIIRDRHTPPPGLPRLAAAINPKANTQLTSPYLASIPPLRPAAHYKRNPTSRGTAKQKQPPRAGVTGKPLSGATEHPQQQPPKDEPPPVLAPGPYLAPGT